VQETQLPSMVFYLVFTDRKNCGLTNSKSRNGPRWPRHWLKKIFRYTTAYRVVNSCRRFESSIMFSSSRTVTRIRPFYHEDGSITPLRNGGILINIIPKDLNLLQHCWEKPRISIIPSSGLLRGVSWFETDVSELSVQTSNVKLSTMGLIGNPKTSVSNHLTPRNNPEDRIIQFYRGVSLQSRTSNIVKHVAGGLQP
jgi:hypothetical protein